MARRQHSTTNDEYDEYSAYSEADASYYRTQDDYASPQPTMTQQAFDWGISGSILAIIVLTIIYALSPVDLVPDIVPVAGQVDDLAAILAGGSSVTFLAALRLVLHSRIGRWGCLIAIMLSSIGAFTVFWLVMQVLDRIF